MLSDLIGNERVKKHLTQMITSGRIGNALLFAGPAGVGKGLFARKLAEALLCQNDPNGRHKFKLDHGDHPDLHVYRPEGKIAMHAIDTMRSFAAEVPLYPNEASHKVFIIEEADRMLPTSSNALLKTFEEPSPDTLIILISAHPDDLLPTIRSRCRTLYFEPIDEKEIARYLVAYTDKGESESASLAARAHGSLATGMRLAQEGADIASERLLDLLAHGRVRDYGELVTVAKELAEELDSKRDQMRDDQKGEWGERLKELPAGMREAIEKEIEGATSRAFAREIDHLLQEVLLWYRDLHLLRTVGEESKVYHRDHLNRLLALDFPLPSLKTVSRAVSQCQLGIARFTKLSTCLETLFLQMGLCPL